MKVRVFERRKGVSYGNIMWPEKFPMRGGKFPKDHPVGGGFTDADSAQCGNGDGIVAFRQRGYWASCFPEGDGITFEPLKDQPHEQVLKDIRECFGWETHP